MKLRLIALAARHSVLPLPQEPKEPGLPFRPLPRPSPPRSEMPEWYRPLALSQLGPEHQPETPWGEQMHRHLLQMATLGPRGREDGMSSPTV